MKLLITGAKGQLGSELQVQLAQGGSPLGPLPDSFKNAQVTAVDLPETDLTDRDAVRALIFEGGFDLVMNCAAYTNVDGCETDFDAAFAVNALAVKYLAEACSETNTELMHISTDYVFAGVGTRPFSECDAPAPVTAYGRTKLMGERYLREFGSKWYILRTSWLYGYQGKNFVKTILGAARKYGKVTVVNDQLGNPTSAVDLAHMMLQTAAVHNYGLYHATGNGICSWYEFTCEILRLAGCDAECAPCTTAEYLAEHPQAAVRPLYSALDNTMLRCTVGDRMRPWQEAIAEYISSLESSN